MGGKSSAENGQSALVKQQTQQGQELFDSSKQRTAQMDALQSPAIAFASAMASGDPSRVAQASAPQIGAINSAYKTSRQNIMDTVGSGAARDFALATGERQKGADVASTLNNNFMGSLGTLFSAGTGQGQFGLQQLGAGLRSTEGASSTNNSVMQAEAQRKATQMGFLGSLAGAAGAASPTMLRAFA